MNIQIKLSDGAEPPIRASEHAAGYDLATTESGIVMGFSTRTFKTGVSIAIPEGYVGKVYSRSGHGFNHGVRLANCVGIIDPDFTGEIKVKLANDSNKDFVIERGMRVGQMVFQKFEDVEFDLVEELPFTARGANGFGSTG